MVQIATCLLMVLAASGVAGCAQPRGLTELAGSTLAMMRDLQEIKALVDPPLETAAQAMKAMKADQRVLGFELSEQSFAISLRLLDDHEIVNGQLGSDPAAAFAATW